MNASRIILIVVLLFGISALAAGGIAIAIKTQIDPEEVWGEAAATAFAAEAVASSEIQIEIANQGTIYDTTMTPLQDDTYKIADFRLWVPDDVETLRGVVVYVHGCTDSSLDIVTNEQWLALAKKWDMALMGTRFEPHGDCLEWMRLEGGSDVAFLAALRVFARQSDHKELLAAPWVFYGYSGGAYWAFWETVRAPDRVVGAFLRSGGKASTIDPAALNVPMVLSKAEVDHIDTTPTFTTYRSQGALWSLAVEANTEHKGEQSSWTLAIPFLDAVCAQRLPPTPHPEGITQLRPIDPAQGWLGNVTTFEIAPVASYQGEPLQAAWLPDETTARTWQEFVKP